MKVLIVGKGCREYALGYKIKEQRGDGVELFFAPGNGGTARLGKNTRIPEKEIASLIKFVEEEKIDLTIVGPEAPLVDGIVDAFERAGQKIFGPNKKAAQIEGSKEFMKEVLGKSSIPTAQYESFIEPELAIDYAKKLRDENPQNRVVLKADGLAAGKGVLIVSSDQEIENGVRNVLEQRIFGSQKLLVEEFLTGFETSLIGFCDGKTIRLFPPVRDHKTIFEGNRGPNTGGMGTFAPDMEATVYEKEIEKEIVRPFIKALQKSKLDYRGIVFFGLMINEKGPKVLEINARFGDPETQSLMLLLESDLIDLMTHTIDQTLKETSLEVRDKKVVNVVLASGGYPDSYEKGMEISGTEGVDHATIFYGGVKEEKGKLFTDGGRVLSVAASGDDFEMARNLAYKGIEAISFHDCYYRRDISPDVQRVYVWKKEEYDVPTHGIKKLTEELGIHPTGIQYYKRYDLEGLNDIELDTIKDTILREPPVDHIAMGLDALKLQKTFETAIVRKYKKGQFDQRLKGLLDTIQSVLPGAQVHGICEEVFTFEGINSEERQKIKDALINPVDQEEGILIEIPATLDVQAPKNIQVDVYEGFIDFKEKELEDFYNELNPAMDIEDLKVVQNYFQSEDRNPTDTEMAMLDTYWSDHCRHTTFFTELTDIQFADETPRDKIIQQTYESYLQLKKDAKDSKPVSLMNLGTIHGKAMRKRGQLKDVEVSDEINACTLIIDAHVDGQDQEYLLFFKNETHNHPTEIEPFGGAQTCLGGAIRDPLSGRGYVYQAMRITGAADPIEDQPMEGKLPQKKIIQDALRGYSSYGNQIGLATGYVEELFHPGFKAKRMEVGAVMGAAPRKYVKRLQPEEGDVIVLLGGRTGRDGVGGATGSSKSHTVESIEEAGAEVQKGHAPTERKIQRLFRRGEVSSLIKKCNDFGAGGVSVAIGELADSLDIYLHRVPLKYSGLTPREIAISESQERMAVVIDREHLDVFLQYAAEENLEATHVADVTNHGRVRMYYEDVCVCDMKREFLNSTGAKRSQDVEVTSMGTPNYLQPQNRVFDEKKLEELLSGLQLSSRKNMLENFDFSVGRSTVVAPLGGKNQLTPIMAMVAKLPSVTDDTDTVSYMSYGYIPQLAEEDPFLGGYYAVMSSLWKAVAAGAPLETIRLSFQEYFQKLGEDKRIWQKPFVSLLGALKATMLTNTPPIGGKDSMSGTFEDLHVPPTLISFAVGYGSKKHVVTSEMKGSLKIGLIQPNFDETGLPTDASVTETLTMLQREIQSGNIQTAYVVDRDSVDTALMKMSFGNDIGFEVEMSDDVLQSMNPLRILVEYERDVPGIEPMGKSGGQECIINGQTLDYHRLKHSFIHGMDPVYGTDDVTEGKDIFFNNERKRRVKSTKPTDVVKVVIPVFEGTNSEYDSALAFRRAGAVVEECIIRNLDSEVLQDSLDTFAEMIKRSQILFIPGGFSMSDEPDGSAKFIANVLRNKKVKSAIEYLLDEEGQDGLILGICNGFQALVKVGLLPYGKCVDLKEDDPTLTFNRVGRHISKIIPTKATTLDSPWLRHIKRGEVYHVPISHGEGRFVVDEKLYEELKKNNQIAFKYLENPNGSAYDIEGLMDPSGKILGKMGHSERVSEDTYVNYPDVEIEDLFSAGVEFFAKDGE
ncbi:MAG: phosphoribosylformylglycinamidine synthase [Tissierellia bacterium]|nr:phosphoribosylformylglycinamidine synthase [Tissierellia bacterium]